MQSVSSRIWTRVAVSISYDDKHYTTGTSSAIGLNSITILFLYRNRFGIKLLMKVDMPLNKKRTQNK